MTYIATRRLQFCAGHRVYKHESKCSNMHGHNYVCYVHARPKEGLDAIGRVIDFSVLKEKVGGWIDTYWDHGFIFYSQDPEMRLLFDTIAGHKWYALEANPTAENMAEHLLHICKNVLFVQSDIEVYKIVLWETENCFVEVDNEG